MKRDFLSELANAIDQTRELLESPDLRSTTMRSAELLTPVIDELQAAASASASLPSESEGFANLETSADLNTASDDFWDVDFSDDSVAPWSVWSH